MENKDARVLAPASRHLVRTLTLYAPSSFRSVPCILPCNSTVFCLRCLKFPEQGTSPAVPPRIRSPSQRMYGALVAQLTAAYLSQMRAKETILRRYEFLFVRTVHAQRMTHRVGTNEAGWKENRTTCLGNRRDAQCEYQPTIAPLSLLTCC